MTTFSQWDDIMRQYDIDWGDDSDSTWSCSSWEEYMDETESQMDLFLTGPYKHTAITTMKKTKCPSVVSKKEKKDKRAAKAQNNKEFISKKKYNRSTKKILFNE